MSEKTKILVVDDEEVVRYSYARSLSGRHCLVEAAQSGQDALLLLDQGDFDLVLLDLRMPGMDGLAVLKAIKERWPESEVIVITGFPSVESAKQAVALGAFDYLAKPAGPDDLINAASKALLHKQWSLRRCQDTPSLPMQ
jgi:DNA-binding NtrC family response regulator